MSNQYKVEDRVDVNGVQGTVTSIARGWYEVELDNGKKAKKRAKDLKPATKVISGSVIPKAIKASYQKYQKRDGKASVDNGDEFAQLYRTLDLPQMYKLAEICTGTNYTGKYDRLNIGMQRMNLGNVIRGACDKDPDQLKHYFQEMK